MINFKIFIKCYIIHFIFNVFHHRIDGWAKDDLIYKWKEKDPVQVVPGLHLPRFTLEQYKSAYCDVVTNTGTVMIQKNGFYTSTVIL